MELLNRVYRRITSGSSLFWLLLLLSIFPLFLLLDYQPLMVYDEARLAKNAQEMVQTGELLVTYYQGKPDMWNTKPPLMIWLQALSIILFGENELAVRLPAALAGLGAVLLLFFFGKKQLRSPAAGFWGGMVLLCTPGFVHWHVTRTGDYDSLLIFFSTAFLLAVFSWIGTTEERARRHSFWAAVLFFVLGVMTKGVVIGIFLPSVLLALLWERQLLPLLRKPYLYAGLLVSVLLIGGYYVGREALNPGYLQAVYENELGGRFLEVVEDHQGGFGYYFAELFFQKFVPWFAWLFLSLPLIYFGKDEKEKRLTSFLLIQAGFFLLILSIGKTKLSWYAAPVYPLLAIIIGLGLRNLYNMLSQTVPGRKLGLGFPLLFMLGVFLYPYIEAVQESMQMKDEGYKWERRQYSSFIRKIPDERDYHIAIGDYNAQVHFLVDASQRNGRDLKVTYPTDLIPGDRVMVCEKEMREKLNKKYRYKVLHRFRECLFVWIEAEK